MSTRLLCRLAIIDAYGCMVEAKNRQLALRGDATGPDRTVADSGRAIDATASARGRAAARARDTRAPARTLYERHLQHREATSRQQAASPLHPLTAPRRTIPISAAAAAGRRPPVGRRIPPEVPPDIPPDGGGGGAHAPVAARQVVSSTPPRSASCAPSMHADLNGTVVDTTTASARAVFNTIAAVFDARCSKQWNTGTSAVVNCACRECASKPLGE